MTSSDCNSSVAALVALVALSVVAPAQIEGDKHWYYDYGAPGSEPFVFGRSGHHLYMGGLFLRVDGDDRKKNLTRFNLLTEAWERVPGIDANFNGGVWAILDGGDGNLYIGGNFSRVGDAEASGVARFRVADGTWSALSDAAPTLATPNQGNGPTNGRVLAIARSGDYFYVGGEFTGPAGSPQNEKYIRRYHAGTGTWERVGDGLDGEVRALAAVGDSGRIVAGGTFSGALAEWDGSAWSVVGGGLGGGTAGIPIVRQIVRAADGTLYIGGDFDVANAAGTPVSVRDVAALRGAEWDPLGGGFDEEFIQSNGTTFLSDGVFALALGPDGLYAGGDFDASAGRGVTGLRHVALWDGSGAWKPLGSGVGVTGSQIVNCLAIGLHGDLFAAGVFNTGFGTLAAPARNFARWHPGRDFTGYLPGAADNSTLQLSPGTGTWSLGFDTRAGTAYQLQSSPDLRTWTDVAGSRLTGDGARMSFDLAAPGPPAGYFRLQAVGR